MKIADVHAHIFPAQIAQKAADSIGEFYGTPAPRAASAEVLLAEERAAGVERILVCNSAVTEHQVEDVNRFIAAQCAAHKEFIGLGSIIPGMENYEEILDSIVARGLKGIKIHSDFQRIPLDAPAAVPMYRACAARGLLVLFHMGDDRYDASAPFRLWNLKRQVPELKVIAAHFGGYRAWDASEKLPMPEGVWYDTSSSLMFLSEDRAKRLLNTLGAERFLFGTDFPMWSPGEEVKRFLSMDLGLTPAERERILYGNFVTLFGE